MISNNTCPPGVICINNTNAIGIIAVFGGLFGSLQWDTPAGPSIVVAASAIFILTILPATSLQMLKSSQLDKPKAK